MMKTSKAKQIKAKGQRGNEEPIKSLVMSRKTLKASKPHEREVSRGYVI
jgi:hypothetical protein